MTRPLRVCFHAAALLWPLWSGGRIAFTGGAEVQQAQIAKGFAARGIEMTVVTCDYGQASPTTVDGVRVLKTYRIEDGPPVLRFFHPRLTRTMSVLHAATADVYYARGGNLEAGEAYLAARRRGAAFVFGAAHDHDARASLPKLGQPAGSLALPPRAARRRRDRCADDRAAGAVPRRVRAREHACAQPRRAPGDGGGSRPPARRPSSGWPHTRMRNGPTGSSSSRVACRACASRMHGVVPPPPESDAAWHATREAARVVPNLEVGEYLDRAGVRALLATAALFVHTSPVEGFPNTVLEAWASGVPSIAAVDPDGIVAREGIGATIADLPQDSSGRWSAGWRTRSRAARRAHARVPTSRASMRRGRRWTGSRRCWSARRPPVGRRPPDQFRGGPRGHELDDLVRGVVERDAAPPAPDVRVRRQKVRQCSR